jgi:hypothetical protein
VRGDTGQRQQAGGGHAREAGQHRCSDHACFL